MIKHPVIFGLALASLLVAGASTAEKGGNDETGPYEVVPNWPQPIHGSAPGNMSWGRTSSVWAESPDRVFVLQSGELPILEHPIGDGGVPVRPAASANNRPDGGPGRWEHIVMIFNRDGKLVDSWEQHNFRFVRPHSVRINPYDPERHVWIVDDGAHVVYQFTNDGKTLLKTLGEFKVPGEDQTHFNRPTDIQFLPNGDFFVSDGYGNSRIVKFNKDGKFLLAWGQKGEAGKETRPSYFNIPHAIAIDAKQRLYVVDNSNARIQVFDANGKHLDTWPNIRFPLSASMSADQFLWVNDGKAQKFMKFTLDGELLYSWGTFGGEPGQLWGTHSFSVDTEGNLYTAEVWGGRAQKFRPKKGANPSHLIGRLFNTTR